MLTLSQKDKLRFKFNLEAAADRVAGCFQQGEDVGRRGARFGRDDIGMPFGNDRSADPPALQPRLVQQALRGEPLTVYGDGWQTRCFCDVRDVVSALIGLAADGQFQERVFNVGSTEEISIRELAQRILKLTGSSSPIHRVPFHEAYAPGFEDMQRRVPDLTRINKSLGWHPTFSLDQTLLATIEHERRTARASN